MPTAAQYRSAARRFRDAGGTARSLLASARAGFGPTVLRGGTLTRDVKAAIDAGHATATRVSNECLSLAAMCDARAAECDAWADRMRAWHNGVALAENHHRWFAHEMALHNQDPKTYRRPLWTPHNPGPRPVPPVYVTL
jgi:hypothetical protein